MRKVPEWLQRAKNLREKEGLSYREIGRRVGAGHDTVRIWLNPGEVDRKYARDAERMRLSIPKPHVPRTPPKAPDHMADAILFAQGKIDRAELSRRLRGAE